jgi:Flp pilus assembly protein TadD
MKIALPATLAAVLLSACSTLQGQLTDAAPQQRPVAAAGTAVSQLPTTIQREAETAWAGRNYGAAASHYAILYQREPENLQFAARYAEAARRSGDARTAVELLDALVGRGLGGAPLQIEMAKANLQLGRAEVALAAARQAVATEPELGEGHVVLGLALDAVGDHGAAAAAYREALAKGAPGSARIFNNLALSLAQAGKLNESVTTLRKATRLDGEAAPISQNLDLIEAIAGGALSPTVKPQKIVAPAADSEDAAEPRMQPRGVTLSDAHRRVPPAGSPGAPVSIPVSVRPAPAADSAKTDDASRPDLDQIATTMAVMRGRMDQLALPVPKSPPAAPPAP